MLSLLVPYYDKNMPDKRGILARCLESFVGRIDDIIVLRDNDMSQYRKLNLGMQMARQPYVLIANDDTWYISGNLKDMCREGKMTRPLINGNSNMGWGHCFCLPMAVYELIGGFDGSYEHGYYDDNDLEFTLRKYGIGIELVDSVNIGHPPVGGTTLERIPGDFRDANQQRFLEKWGRLP